MLNRLIYVALHNRLPVLVGALLLLIGGWQVARTTDVDVFPDLTAPTVVVLTEAHGLAPEEVERLVSFPIESAVNGATQVRRVRSSSSAGISVVWVEFDWGTDVFRARQVVSEKMQTITGNLPQGVGVPTLAPQSSIMGEIMLISLTAAGDPATGDPANKTSAMDLRSLADWTIRPRLLSLSGVAQVITIGGDYKQYQVLLDPMRMNQFGVTLPDVLEASRDVNRNTSGGLLYQYHNEYLVRGLGRTSDVAEMGSGVVTLQNGLPIRLADVAEVRTGAAPKIGSGALRGDPAVIMTVMKQPQTNTLNLTERIDSAVVDLQKTLPADVKLNTRIFRQADFISASVGNVQRTLLEGSLFVVVILILFLANVRTTFISLLAIPLSLLVSILTLRGLGLTINTMTLGGMAIAIGDLVDDAIIDVENVYRRLRENARLPKADRQPVLDVIYHASVEIRASVISATFIIIAAFLPLFFLGGIEGRLLQPLGIAFVVSLLASLLVALTITPVLCSFLLTSSNMLADRQADGRPHESWLVRRLNGWYSRTLTRALRHGNAVLIASGVLLVAALGLLSQMGRSFLPEFNEGSLVISAVSLPGISLDESNAIGTRVERALLTIPEIQTTTRRTGRAELDEHAQGVNAAEIDAPFVLATRTREEFMADVRKKLAGLSGLNITIGQPIGHRIDHMLSGTRANLAIKVYGPDLGQLFTLSNGVKAAIDGTDGLVDLSVEPQIEIPQVQIRPNRPMLARYGITMGQFTEFVDVALAGEKVADVFEGNRSYDLIVRYADAYRTRLEVLPNTLIDTPTSGKIPLRLVADVISTSGPNTINREGVQRRVVVSANVAGRDLRSVVEDVQARINSQIKLPEGYRIEYGGQFESEGRASQTIALASLVSLLLIFLLLVGEFRKPSLAGIILLNLPLALIGGVVSLWLTGGIVSIPALIGFITLFGVATRNGILLVAHYRTLEAAGETRHDAVIHGSVDRLSPILMTALTAGLALIPLALAGSEPGNEIQSPMAKVILGGLLSSTLLNLFVIPIVYGRVMKRQPILPQTHET
ncbi:efflux RND transporter permease subunit [Spirosoma montaniterrae]|uniref:Multidrug transporter AcrB n=1 Tax=Spirosoma montaniterrae TaxID=1178516 RepID=A0A1P9WWB5_9BACT|nr:efflux RND transporter permease subunit [Spirosoma montaniterrae]AQG79608.1 multidrug transporter AcrB [Spirosoma montaniterrae]